MKPAEMGIEPQQTSQPRTLRPYQSQAVGAVESDWDAGIRRVGVVLPTGSGKSTVIGKLASNAYHRGQRVLLLAHRGELIDQMIENLLDIDHTIPHQHIGVVRAELDDHHAPIVGATLQTLANASRRKALGKRDVIIWDEVHHAPAEGYHATFRELGGYDDALMCGMTATMYRADKSKGKTENIGLGDVIEKISFERDLKWAIEEGYLVPPTGLTVRIKELDALDKIKNIAGDFHQGDLAEIMEAAVEYTVDAIEKHAADRRSIVFAASVAASHQIVDLINERGNLRAMATTGAMGYEERKPVYEAFRTGEIDIMVTVAVLTEGADFPMCDAVVMARPTRSRILYTQMVGRAIRLYTDPVTGVEKVNGLVLDLAGSTRRMKLVHLSELVYGMGIESTSVDEAGEPIECPECGRNIEQCTCEPEDTGGGATIRVRRQGPVDMVSINLLENDDTLWLQTPAGVPFISLERGPAVFLWPNEDRTLWTVGQINTRTGRGGWIDGDEGAQQYRPQEDAVRAAQQWCRNEGHDLPSKYATWRTRSQAPSELQMKLARKLHIPAYEGMTKGRLSDEISIAFVANLLDAAMEG